MPGARILVPCIKGLQPSRQVTMPLQSRSSKPEWAGSPSPSALVAGFFVLIPWRHCIMEVDWYLCMKMTFVGCYIMMNLNLDCACVWKVERTRKMQEGRGRRQVEGGKREDGGRTKEERGRGKDKEARRRRRACWRAASGFLPHPSSIPPPCILLY